MSVSANASSDGVLWATEWTTPGVLHAYYTTNLTHERYNTTRAGFRDTLDNAVKFNTSMIASGKASIGMPSQLVVLGLPPSAKRPRLDW